MKVTVRRSGYPPSLAYHHASFGETRRSLGEGGKPDYILMVAFDMPERLTRADVDRIATLARLELSDTEKELFVQQLSHVLEYAEQIQRIDTTGVEPTSQVLSRLPADRPDESRPGLSNSEAVANAPDASLRAGLFRVPRVIT
jgi:aspartyl-tRNA(Asn)/glutamyl-tRNA(Gln) amidotransferase subunit C